MLKASKLGIRSEPKFTLLNAAGARAQGLYQVGFRNINVNIRPLAQIDNRLTGNIAAF
jgi:hypothetical protein